MQFPNHLHILSQELMNFEYVNILSLLKIKKYKLIRMARSDSENVQIQGRVTRAHEVHQVCTTTFSKLSVLT